MLEGFSSERAAARLIRDQQYRVLRRLDLDARAEPANDNAGTKVAIVVDVETTGTDVLHDAIIELSLRRFRFDDAGVVTKLDRSFSWLEDPGRPLDPAITAITSLTDADLHRRCIDDAAATALLRSAHVRIAFHAAFDCKFVQRRLPRVAGLPWACAMREVDWRARGFDGGGRSLGWILAQCGFFNDRAHRAAGDVDATIAILEHRSPAGVTALFELLETAAQPGWRVAAVGAHFCVKDRLKARGYKWDAADGCWWCEVEDDARQAEVEWLSENVYAPYCMPRMDGPSLRELTWVDRHA